MDMLAAAMRERGFKWTKTTVFNVEHGERQLRLTEAESVLECLDLDIQRDMPKLLFSGIDAQAMDAIHSLDLEIEQLEQACTAIFRVRYVLEEYLDVSLQEPVPGNGIAAMPSNDVSAKIKQALSNSNEGEIIRRVRYWLNEYEWKNEEMIKTTAQAAQELANQQDGA